MQTILDDKDLVPCECSAFIEEALNKGESTLVHSVKGQSRACTILAAFIMRRYRWSLLKALEFLNSRRCDLEVRASCIRQLTAYENRLIAKGLGPKTAKWTEVFDRTDDFENEELLLRNTYLNAQMGPFADFRLTGGIQTDNPHPKIRWADTDPKTCLVTFIACPVQPVDKAKPPTISAGPGTQHRQESEARHAQPVPKESGNKLSQQTEPAEEGLRQPVEGTAKPAVDGPKARAQDFASDGSVVRIVRQDVVKKQRSVAMGEKPRAKTPVKGAAIKIRTLLMPKYGNHTETEGMGYRF